MPYQHEPGRDFQMIFAKSACAATQVTDTDSQADQPFVWHRAADTTAVETNSLQLGKVTERYWPTQTGFTRPLTQQVTQTFLLLNKMVQTSTHNCI